MVIQNWFMVVIAVIQVIAAIRYLMISSPMLAGVTFLYAVCNMIFAMMRGI